MRLKWCSDWNFIGNGYGYSTHQKMLRAALERWGVEFTDDAKVAVHIVVPTGFEPEPDKFNILYTMYEATTLPKEWIDCLRAKPPDLLVVPCEHNVPLFQQYTKARVRRCWEGVDTSFYAFKERTHEKGKLFTFLYNGASNPRKGYEQLAIAWKYLWDRWPEVHAKCQIIFKTTQVSKPERLAHADAAHVHFDNRNYSRENLLELYHFANAFALPSMGEGFGLTLAEAMSTGLPCIYTPWSGPRDFLDESTGYPVKFRMHPINTLKIDAEGKQERYHSTYAAYADPESIARRMVQIVSDYDEALARGRRAAERIRKSFTWEESAASFMRLVEQYAGEG